MAITKVPDGVLAGSGWMQRLQYGSTVLSASGWLQQLQAATLVVQGITPITLDGTYRFVLSLGGDGGGGDTNLPVYLPKASSVPAGFDITFKLISAPLFEIEVYPQVPDTIDGTSSYNVPNPLGYVTMVSDGVSNWYVVSASTDNTTIFTTSGGLGVFGTTPPSVQPPLCVTLADVIAVLVGCGLCAAS
jgi:hypothetical protein